MRSLTAALIVLAIAPYGTFAHAQGANPSVDQIIKSLTPTGDVSKVGTRGIRLAPQPGTADGVAPAMQAAPDAHRPTPHVTMAATKPVVTAPTPTDAVPAVNLTVNFATGSAVLTPKAMEALDTLGAALSSEALSHYRFRVEGHTDTVGTPDLNRALSEQRAEAVVSYIASKFGVAADRLQPVGMGSDKPLISTAAQVPEPRNRRVQVVNIGS